MATELEATFDAFATASAPHLRRLARTWCRDAHRADDLVQEALERLWSAWPRVRADGNPAAYARTTLVRVLISDARRPWRRLEVVHDLLPERSAPAAASVAGDDAAETHDRMLDAVRALPPRQRAVVLLRYAEDQSVAQVAEALGCSEGTVKSQASRALGTLRARLADCRPTTTEVSR
ncbi:RNA polymerase sigma-70 factor, sigma-E family [Quadrisphaera granulorum]|uniref:RNA polymerase sigma-70 factor (Sigma-E family) n=1 Tax=Quadrisphaera granulorum TaxID=317664 RepID=A0A315ZPQ3_9ACTN|nr:SigE family RNA polymerase sigma factor [Quadrisphaera granulorum]PWJ46990.1 RNA polymerase sigma-70 factor (sigma-E family) [Quadrisphaera granulorum]SZE98986.1 RNA polymerase sigma-70 factor, sigma-E family [Quadrisphaera granulorum]